MNTASTSWGSAAENALTLAPIALHATLSNVDRKLRVEELGRRLHDITRLVYALTQDHDDEVLNWTFPDLTDDLSAASWNLVSGYYKAAASCMRNGLDLANAALYFQVREESNIDPSGYNRFFAEWDAGERNTPGWGETKGYLKTWARFAQFQHDAGIDALEECYAYFHRLSAFTHGRPWDKVTGEPTSGLNMGSAPPDFDVQLFERFLDLFATTIGWICAIWVIAFPEVVAKDPLNSTGEEGPYLRLLSGVPIGELVLAWSRGQTTEGQSPTSS